MDQPWDEIEESSADVGPSTAAAAETGSPGRNWLRRLDIATVVLLGIASLLAAWAGHQATLWNGEANDAITHATEQQFAATRLTAAGYQMMGIDVAVFLDWLTAYRQDDPELRAFYERRFTPQLKTAFDAWQATQPLTNPAAPTDPFRMPDYQVPELQQANAAQDQTEAFFGAAAEANGVAEAYVLATILLAIVLFFGGVSTKADRLPIRVVLLSLTVLLLIFAAAKLAVLPDASAWHLTPLFAG